MITKRKEEIRDEESKKFIEMMVEKYYNAFFVDRGVGNGEIYDQTGRQPGRAGEEVGSIDQLDIGR